MVKVHRPRICIITGGHLATCPRMVKAADTLADAGYKVRVVSARSTAWATEADFDLVQHRAGHWEWDVVDYRRHGDYPAYLTSGIRYTLARMAAASMRKRHLPLWLASSARARAYARLARLASEQPADLVYGGGSALEAAASTSRRLGGIPFALDLEDFHSEEEDYPTGQPRRPLTERVESALLPRAAFLTAGSAPIASAYEAKYGVRPIPINNAFPLPAQEPIFSSDASRPLRLYWFSQTVGPRRGLELVVAGVARSGVPAEIHLRGLVRKKYADELHSLCAREAPRATIHFLPPAPPDQMVSLCRDYDVGLAFEQLDSPNRQICLSNKLLTYVLSGLAVALTETIGQKQVAHDIGPTALVCPPKGVDALGAGLRAWSEDRDLLLTAKKASWDAARRRWHWEHPLESGALVAAVERVFGRPSPWPMPANR
jgi:hypothetical protein